MKELFVLFLLSLLIACQEENKPPTCTITSPSDGDELGIGEVVTISVDAEDPDGSVSEVRFDIDGSDQRYF